MRRGSRPGLWLTLATMLLLQSMLIALGFWQLDRAAQKRLRYEQYQSRLDAPAVELGLSKDIAPQDLHWRPVWGRGTYRGPTFLLDNRIRRGSVGYEIFSALELGDGARVLIDRGWIAAPPVRSELPVIAVPDAELTIPGRAGPPPATGIRISDEARAERLGADVYRVQAIDFDLLATLLEAPLVPFVVYLDPQAPYGYDRAWPPPASDVGKHQAYAAQWFAMAGVLLIICVAIAVRSRAVAKVP